MTRYSVVFCGTPEFAIPSLRALTADARFDVRLVITQPDRPVGRSGRAIPPPMKNAAIDLGRETWQPERLNVQFGAENYHLGDRPDFLVVVAYGQLLSQAVLDWPLIAPVNVHASLLPRWRGASPIEHAILHGDAETGITVQRMVKELDAGPILGMVQTPIGEHETAQHLRDRLAQMGATLLVDVLSAPLEETPQPTNGVTICRKLSRDDGKADLATMEAVMIDRMARALCPWPGVTVTVDGCVLKLHETSLQSTESSMPLACAHETILHAIRVQEPGGKPMSGAAWARGKGRSTKTPILRYS